MKNLRTIIYLTSLLIALHSGLSSPQSTIQNILNQVNIDSLTFFVKQLSGVVPAVVNGQQVIFQSREKSSPYNDIAGQFIKQKFESYGLQTSLQSFSSTGKNVLGIKTGTQYPNQKYIICAHYDDIAGFVGDPAPGADDNASGTATVIEAARVLSQYNSEYTLVFAAWDEEEWGLLGSGYYANQAATNGDSILGVINIDMIAYNPNNDSTCKVHTRTIANSLAISDKMIEINQLYNIGLTTLVVNPGIGFSDHQSFWMKNFSAIFLHEEPRNPHYHTSNDVIEHFNFPYFHKCAKLAIGTVAWFVFDYTIPVELTGFTANCIDGSIILNWSTASETNNKGFEIQKLEVRNQNSENWSVIGFINGSGTTTEKINYSFTDDLTLNLNHNLTLPLKYRLKQIDLDGSFEYSKEIEIEVGIPTEFLLYQNYPNPFNPSTKIRWQSPVSSWQTLKVYDVLGNEVSVLVDKYKTAGTYEVDFSTTNGLVSGVYFYQLKAGEFIQTKKMIMSR